jgi:hypothetical protein
MAKREPLRELGLIIAVSTIVTMTNLTTYRSGPTRSGFRSIRQKILFIHFVLMAYENFSSIYFKIYSIRFDQALQFLQA